MILVNLFSNLKSIWDSYHKKQAPKQPSNLESILETIAAGRVVCVSQEYTFDGKNFTHIKSFNSDSFDIPLQRVFKERIVRDGTEYFT